MIKCLAQDCWHIGFAAPTTEAVPFVWHLIDDLQGKIQEFLIATEIRGSQKCKIDPIDDVLQDCAEFDCGNSFSYWKDMCEIIMHVAFLWKLNQLDWNNFRGQNLCFVWLSIVLNHFRCLFQSYGKSRDS